MVFVIDFIFVCYLNSRQYNIDESIIFTYKMVLPSALPVRKWLARMGSPLLSYKRNLAVFRLG